MTGRIEFNRLDRVAYDLRVMPGMCSLMSHAVARALASVDPVPAMLRVSTALLALGGTSVKGI
ncbi:MAG: hypothetical protein JWN13_212 [Betaproteobacteria bacterium]|nr:hypothetical protein [Betaproteobacteria bacterium]